MALSRQILTDHSASQNTGLPNYQPSFMDEELIRVLFPDDLGSSEFKLRLYLFF